MSVRNPELASPRMAGNRAISEDRVNAAFERLVDEWYWTPEWCFDGAPTLNALWMVLEYAAYRYERGEIDGARQTLMRGTGCDLTSAYVLEAVMHVPGVR